DIECVSLFFEVRETNTVLKLSSYYLTHSIQGSILGFVETLILRETSIQFLEFIQGKELLQMWPGIRLPQSCSWEENVTHFGQTLPTLVDIQAPESNFCPSLLARGFSPKYK